MTLSAYLYIWIRKKERKKERRKERRDKGKILTNALLLNIR